MRHNKGWKDCPLRIWIVCVKKTCIWLWKGTPLAFVLSFFGCLENHHLHAVKMQACFQCLLLILPFYMYNCSCNVHKASFFISYGKAWSFYAEMIGWIGSIQLFSEIFSLLMCLFGKRWNLAWCLSLVGKLGICLVLFLQNDVYSGKIWTCLLHNLHLKDRLLQIYIWKILFWDSQISNMKIKDDRLLIKK